MRIISTIMNFYWSHVIALQKLSNELRSYKYSCILSLTEVTSIRILRMRLISAIMNFYWSHAIALQKLSHERSYKFSWILTLAEVIISFRNLYILLKSKLITNPYPITLQTNTHRCELVMIVIYFKGRTFRDFWQNSRKFVPAKYLLSIYRESLFSRKKKKSFRLAKVKKSKNLNLDEGAKTDEVNVKIRLFTLKPLHAGWIVKF